MSLLQDPYLAAKQISWYFDSRAQEAFPGAFLLAAGDLARQLLEQVVFILAFYSNLPRGEYLRGPRALRPLAHVINALGHLVPTGRLTYLEQARRRGPRIRKLAKPLRTLHRWRRLLNEPSHFANPAGGRGTTERHIRDFVEAMRQILEPVDAYLVVAAVNEIRSGGFIKAILTTDPDNKPGVLYTSVVTPRQLQFENGKFKLKTPIPIVVLSKTQELPYRWRRKVVVIQDSGGMVLQGRFVTSSGRPLNMINFAKILETFAADPIDGPILIPALKRLGFRVVVSDGMVRATLDSHSAA